MKVNEPGLDPCIERIRPVCSLLSHDLNNVVGILQGYVELLRTEVHSVDGHSFLEQVAEATARLQGRSEELQDFYVRRASLSIAYPVVSLIQPLLEAYPPVHFKLDVPEETQVTLDPTTFPSAISEILSNAREASPEQCIEVELAQAATFLQLRVKNPAALAASDLRRAFDPWFSTRSRQRGLGLARVFGNLSRQGLAFRMYSDESTSVVFEIDLPLARV